MDEEMNRGLFKWLDKIKDQEKKEKLFVEMKDIALRANEAILWSILPIFVSIVVIFVGASLMISKISEDSSKSIGPILLLAVVIIFYCGILTKVIRDVIDHQRLFLQAEAIKVYAGSQGKK